MKVSKHIFSLLKYHECVIIPEFGGFISNYKPAQFDQFKNTFIPPSKEVVFNNKIKKNDGLLIKHIVELEKIGYSEAELAVMNFVDRLLDTLNKGEKIELEELGTFQYDRSGAVIFHPNSSFELIEAYGLTEFNYPTLHESSPVFQARPAIRAFNRRKDVIKIAASIALLLSLSLYPIKNSKFNLHSSVLDPSQFLNETLPVQTTAEEHTDKNIAIFEEQIKTSYILVGGSFQDFENATQLQHELLNNGYPSEIIELESGFYRVIIDSFKEKEPAVKAMLAYRSNHKGSKAWVSLR